MAKQSLAAKAGALSTELKLPSIFSAPVEVIAGRKLSPYITFAHPKRTDEWAKIRTKCKATVEEGDMFLVESDSITALPVVKLGWLCHKQYWCKANPAGEIQQVSWVEHPVVNKEHVEAVVLVYFGDRIVPANVCFRTTKCGAAKIMGDALAKAATVEWAEESAAHAESMVCAQPFMRFYGEVSLGATRTSKATGMPYRPSQCAIHPTALQEWRLLEAFTKSENVQEQLDKAAKRFEFRIKELMSKPQP